MKYTAVFFVVLTLGCHTDVPEGVYPCNSAADCPSLWVCRADRRCWMREVDAGPPSDAAVDAIRPDAPTCSEEACNGHDDDCDGLIDEALLRAGPPIPAAIDTDLAGGLLVPLSAGFGLFAVARPPSFAGWTTIDVHGASTSIVTRSSDILLFLDVATSGNVVATSAAGGTSHLVTVSMDAPETPRSTYVFDHGGVAGFARVASFDGRFATAFVEYDASGVTLWRTRIDTSMPSGFLVSDSMVATITSGGTLGLLHTPQADYVAYSTQPRGIVIAVAPSDANPGGYREIGEIAAPFGDAPTSLELAIRDATIPVSDSNPIGVAWTTQSRAFFTEITNTTVLAADAPRQLIGATGTGIAFISLRSTALVPAQTTFSEPRHWLVANNNTNGTDAASFRTMIFEVTPRAVSEIALTDEVDTDRLLVGMAQSGGVVRLAEGGNTGGVVTRSIGCE